MKSKRYPVRTAELRQMSISLEVDLLEEIKRRARLRQQSVSGYLRYAALREMQERIEHFPPINARAVNNSTEPKHSP